MWQYIPTHNSELFHHGKKDQKWGVQNGPPYPLESPSKRSFTKSTNYDSISSKTFNKKPSDFNTVFLELKEYAHVMSEIMTHMTCEERTHDIVTKPVGDYIYTVENRNGVPIRAIGKKAILGSAIESYERVDDDE